MKELQEQRVSFKSFKDTYNFVGETVIQPVRTVEVPSALRIECMS